MIMGIDNNSAKKNAQIMSKLNDIHKKYIFHL